MTKTQIIDKLLKLNPEGKTRSNYKKRFIHELEMELLKAEGKEITPWFAHSYLNSVKSTRAARAKKNKQRRENNEK